MCCQNEIFHCLSSFSYWAQYLGRKSVRKEWLHINVILSKASDIIAQHVWNIDHSTKFAIKMIISFSTDFLSNFMQNTA